MDPLRDFSNVVEFSVDSTFVFDIWIIQCRDLAAIIEFEKFVNFFSAFALSGDFSDWIFADPLDLFSVDFLVWEFAAAKVGNFGSEIPFLKICVSRSSQCPWTQS